MLITGIHTCRESETCFNGIRVLGRCLNWKYIFTLYKENFKGNYSHSVVTIAEGWLSKAELGFSVEGDESDVDGTTWDCRELSEILELDVSALVADVEESEMIVCAE